MNSIVVYFIRKYQKRSAKRSYGVCKFEPSCSEYARLCFKRLNFFKACRLTLNRLRRCDANFPMEIDNPPKN